MRPPSLFSTCKTQIFSFLQWIIGSRSDRAVLRTFCTNQPGSVCVPHFQSYSAKNTSCNAFVTDSALRKFRGHSRRMTLWKDGGEYPGRDGRSFSSLLHLSDLMYRFYKALHWKVKLIEVNHIVNNDAEQWCNSAAAQIHFLLGEIIWFVFYESKGDGWIFNPAHFSSLPRQYFLLQQRLKGRAAKINWSCLSYKRCMNVCRGLYYNKTQTSVWEMRNQTDSQNDSAMMKDS